MNMSEETIKHLEFIQNIITRMNTNSFQIKGWTIAIVSATLALYATTKNNCFILIGIFPSLVFWFLDAYYLTQEKKFRGLYDDVAGISEKPNKIKPFEMRLDLYKNGTFSYCGVLQSKTIRNFYLCIILILLCIYTLLKIF